MEQIDLKVRGGGPLRCAFCHDSVAAEERSACADCLAVHHDACWREAGRCASCQGTRPLLAPGMAAPSPVPLPPRVAARQASQPAASAAGVSPRNASREFVSGTLLALGLGAAGLGIYAISAAGTPGVAPALGLFVLSAVLFHLAWRVA